MVRQGKKLGSRQNKKPKYEIYTLDGHDLNLYEYQYYKYLMGKATKTEVADHAQDSDNKKAADDGGHTVQELAPGYKTESGKPLSEVDEKEFILKPNGSKDFGEITDAISKAAKEQSGVDLAPGKIRLRVGNNKEGLLHAKKHEEQAKADGYTSIEDMIADVAENFDSIYAHSLTGDGHTTYSLIKHGNKATGKMNGVAPVYLNLEDDGHGNYYVIVTAIPKGDANLARQTKKDRLIYSSPGLGAATESNAGAVSTSAKNQKMLEPKLVGVPLHPINQAVLLLILYHMSRRKAPRISMLRLNHRQWASLSMASKALKRRLSRTVARKSMCALSGTVLRICRRMRRSTRRSTRVLCSTAATVSDETMQVLPGLVQES